MATNVLRWDERLNVSYCIPIYLRNEQIRINTRLVRERLVPPTSPETSPEPVAVVGYGPSLKDTWEKIREFKTVFSCSGAHKFLIERGIVPSYHVEVDPRAYKIKLLGDPHPDVVYLPCSAVHPDYLRHLMKAGSKIRLWHVFDTKDESQRITPRGEWMITGGCDAGLRAMALARFLGYVNLHMFGFDGSSPEQGGARHAGAHPNPVRAVSQVELDGRKFFTTPAMLEAAKGIWHELEQLPDVQPTFYGDGLIQHASKTWQRKNTSPTVIAAIQAPLISDELRQFQAALHAGSAEYGSGGAQWAKMVRELVDQVKPRKGPGELPTVLDYGCGKGFLAEELPFPIWEYDPAVPGKERMPRPSDIVVCTDVLEHVEPTQLDSVLDDLRRVVRQIGFFVVCSNPAFKKLPDGRNTHLIVMPKTWWQLKLAEYFVVAKTIEKDHRLHFVVAPQAKPKKMVARQLTVPGKIKERQVGKAHRFVLEALVKDHQWKLGAEVGCLRGRTTFHLLKSCPELTLYAIDIWDHYDGLSRPREEGGQSRLKYAEETTYDKLVPFEVLEELFREDASKFPERVRILKGLSWELAAEIEDASLDFVFIDADHTEEAVRKDIEAWRPKVRPGGWLMGHDICLASVRRAVDALCPGWRELDEAIWAQVKE